jgi:hypothetical protein
MFVKELGEVIFCIFYGTYKIKDVFGNVMK